MSMDAFATTEDMTAMWRPMTPAETERAGKLLAAVSAALRVEARRRGRDLDSMLAVDPDLRETARAVTVDVTARALMTATDQEPVTQFTQTAGPYSYTGSYLIPGGGLFIKDAELARLGLLRQRYGVIDFYGPNQGHNGKPV